jgi:hypothetical protein
MPLKNVTPNGLVKTVSDNFNILSGGIAGEVFYVDGNAGDDTNNGKSWDAPFKKLSVALAASHADIASKAFGWTARNIIYLKDDEVAEDLTKLADKTDVIGVGSYDRWSQPRILGNHIIVGTYIGTRFINCFFKEEDGGDIWTVPTTVSGLSFIGCTFDGTTPATGAIVATKVPSLTIQGCRFLGAFSDAVIEIAGTGEAPDLLIADNFIQGGQQGIDVKSTITSLQFPGYIVRNYISAVTECINEASGKIYVHNNTVVTAANKGSAGAGAIVAGAKMMLQNYAACGDATGLIIPANASL